MDHDIAHLPPPKMNIRGLLTTKMEFLNRGAQGSRKRSVHLGTVIVPTQLRA